MRKTSLAIDELLFEQARAALGTETLRDTVEQAFLEVLRARARREEVIALRHAADLADSDLMQDAWPP